jgi:hypothetical protein
MAGIVRARPVLVGADGRYSLVARTVEPRRYQTWARQATRDAQVLPWTSPDGP